MSQLLGQTFEALKRESERSYDRLAQELIEQKMKLDMAQDGNKKLLAKIEINEKSLCGVEYMLQSYKAIKGVISEDSALKILKQNSLQFVAEFQPVAKQVYCLIE